MWTKQKRKTNRSRFILPIITVAVLSYFGYHIYHGEYGLYSRENVDEHIMVLNSELHKLETQRQTMELKVSLLRDGEIEKDMLDEWARRNLSVSNPNELTIITSQGDKSN
ncbi:MULTISPECIES: FtsB family cell division protein [unclassified Bartonella]|uniref:FtsB family cell division protein n=1 Tax=unclassified Bartonella TaxID=2645622 RepID=UPI0015FD1D51|nr:MULTISPECIES: septum formation initiator family protein [unclassified Bartonella]UXN04403.1 septum formation initiator family protein [Bartonella sp. HY406]UXN07397.1 septum formation initiator family protein [Bartonella sp. HY761]